MNHVLRTALCCVVATAGRDVLPPGHRGAVHELVLVASAAPEGSVVVAAPTRGFGGVEVVRLGAPFPFSSKYGTRLYVLPGGAAPPDAAALREGRHGAGVRIPVAEVASVPLASRVARVETRLRLVAATGADGGYALEVVGETRSDAHGREVAGGLGDDARFLLALTVAVETALALLLARRGERRRAGIVCVIANLVTHPAAWAALAAAGGGYAAWVGVEVAVLGVEVLVYRLAGRLAWSRAFVIATAANATSAVVGLAL